MKVLSGVPQGAVEGPHTGQLVVAVTPIWGLHFRTTELKRLHLYFIEGGYGPVRFKFIRTGNFRPRRFLKYSHSTPTPNTCLKYLLLGQSFHYDSSNFELLAIIGKF